MQKEYKTATHHLICDNHSFELTFTFNEFNKLEFKAKKISTDETWKLSIQSCDTKDYVVL